MNRVCFLLQVAYWFLSSVLWCVDRDNTVVCALHTCAVFFLSSLHVRILSCIYTLLSMYYFCVGSGGAKPVMHHVLPLSIPLQAVAAAIWIIKVLLHH